MGMRNSREKIRAIILLGQMLVLDVVCNDDCDMQIIF